jgi:hypothetical protein
MTSCSICLGNLPGDDEYHPECIESLFRTTTLPVLDVELSMLYSLAASKMAGRSFKSKTSASWQRNGSETNGTVGSNLRAPFDLGKHP